MSTHDERVEAVLKVLSDETGVNTKDAFMVLGEVAGCLLAFVPEEHRTTYADTLRIHVLGIAQMRKSA